MLDIFKCLLTGAGLSAIFANDYSNKERADKKSEMAKKKFKYMESLTDFELIREMKSLLNLKKWREDRIFDMIGDDLKEVYGDGYKEIFRDPKFLFDKQDIIVNLLLSKTGHVNAFDRQLTLSSVLPPNEHQDWIDLTYQIQKNLQAHGVDIKYGIVIDHYCHGCIEVDNGTSILIPIEDRASKRQL